MKSVLISTQPKWCELIANGEKTIEVRKTRPKIETPFKCYIYCTKQRMTKVPCMYSYLHINEPKASLRYEERITTWGNIGDVIVNRTTPYEYVSYGMQGKVFGEFVCDWIEKIYPYSVKEFCANGCKEIVKATCLSDIELANYAKGKPLYFWRISYLKIYDKPKELGEFRKPCHYTDGTYCLGGKCEYYSDFTGLCCNFVERPFQSWGYIND